MNLSSIILLFSASAAQVILGGLAKLPCDVTTTQPGDKVALVIWYREGRLSPIYR